jgi:hypothetical protein
MEANSASDEEYHDALSEISPYNGKKSEQIDKPESEKRLVSSTVESEKSEEGEEEDESSGSSERYESSGSIGSSESSESSESSQDDSESSSKKEHSWPNLEAPLPLEPPSEKQSSLSPLTSTEQIICPSDTQETELKLKTALFAWSTQNLTKVILYFRRKTKKLLSFKAWSSPRSYTELQDILYG